MNDIENLFVRNILGVSDNIEVNLDKELHLIKKKKSIRSAKQRSYLINLYEEIRK